MLKRKILCFPGLLVVLLICFAAASGVGFSATEPVSLRFSWWGTAPRHEATLQAISVYEKMHPNVKITGEYQGNAGYQQKIMTQLAGGTAPDIIQYDYMWMQSVTAIEDDFFDFKSTKDTNLSQWPKNILDSFCTVHGRVVGLPMGTTTDGAIIIKSFFNKYHLPFKQQYTWDWLISEGKKIHDAHPDDYLVGYDPIDSTWSDDFITAMIYSQTGKYWATDKDKKLNVSRADILKAFTLLNNLFTSGAFMPMAAASPYTTKIVNSPDVLNGHIGMLLDGASFVQNLEALLPKGAVTVAKPCLNSDAVNKTIYIKPALLAGVNNHSKNRNEAVKFLSWFLTSEKAAVIMKDLRATPMAKTPLRVCQKQNLLNPNITTMTKWALQNPSEPVPLCIYDSQMLTMLGDICRNLGFKVVTPEQATDQLIKGANARLEELRKL